MQRVLKTRTGCKIISRMIEEGDIDDVIVTTYFTDILDQWQRIRRASATNQAVQPPQEDNQSDEFEPQVLGTSRCYAQGAFGKF